ncbi:hypothetical protein Bca4012_016515 [Brassica carinata]
MLSLIFSSRRWIGVKSLKSGVVRKKGLFELARDRRRELEAELKKMTPVNGRAVLVFRAKCGCCVGSYIIDVSSNVYDPIKWDLVRKIKEKKVDCVAHPTDVNSEAFLLDILGNFWFPRFLLLSGIYTTHVGPAFWS